MCFAAEANISKRDPYSPVMKRIALFAALISIASLAVLAQDTPGRMGTTSRIDPDPAKGFSYPYYLYLPPGAAKTDPKALGTLLVIPNNTGTSTDDFAEHEKNVTSKMVQVGFIFGQLDVPVLIPVFPRPRTEWKIYTHALDRDSLVTDIAEYKRLDLQLAAMIRDARAVLESEGVRVGEKVLMYGFSASGMFTNRFAFLHPELVKGAAVGSPGGWPIAPSSSFRGKGLRYPIGIGDVEALTGSPVDLNSLKKVPFLVFLGSEDENDSLVFRDGYEEEDEKLVFELFGQKPVDRWEASEKLYSEAGLNAVFKLYPGEGHRPSRQMVEDVLGFLKQNKY